MEKRAVCHQVFFPPEGTCPLEAWDETIMGHRKVKWKTQGPSVTRSPQTHGWPSQDIYPMCKSAGEGGGQKASSKPLEGAMDVSVFQDPGHRNPLGSDSGAQEEIPEEWGKARGYLRLIEIASVSNLSQYLLVVKWGSPSSSQRKSLQGRFLAGGCYDSTYTVS